MDSKREGWLRSQETDRLSMYEKCILPLWLLMVGIRALQALITLSPPTEVMQILNFSLGTGVPVTYWLLKRYSWDRTKWYFITLITEVSYMANALSAARLTGEQFATLCVASTVFYLMMLQPWYSSSWVSTLMTIRHIVLWHWVYKCVFRVEGWGGLAAHPSLAIAILVSVGAWMRQKTLWDMSYDRYSSRELADDQRRLIEAIFEAVPVGVIMLDSTLSLKKHNSNASHLMDTQCLHSALNEVRLVETQQTLLEAAQSLLLQNSANSIEFGQTEIGNRTLLWQGTLFKWKGEKSVLLVCSDISELVQLEHKARFESEAKTMLLRSVSHELKTPLNAMINLSEDVSVTESLTPAAHEKLAIVLSSGKLLLFMINDLLDYTQSLAGSLSIEKRRFNLLTLIQDVANVVSLQCRSKGLTFVAQLSKTPHFGYTDPGRLSQLLMGVLNFVTK